MDSTLKRSIIIALLVLAGLMLLAAGWWLLKHEFSYGQYKDTTYQFSIKYPKSWKVMIKPQEGVAVVFQSPPDTALDVFLENVNIAVNPVPDQIASLKSFSETITKQMTVVFKNNIKILEDKDITVAGRAGHRLILETPAPESLRSEIMWTIKGSNAFIFTFMGKKDKYEATKPMLDEMVSSFQL